MTSTATPRWRFEARLWPGAVVDGAVIVATFAGSLLLALMADGMDGVVHGGSAPLDPIGVLLLVLSTVPLAAWRRAPLAVFAVTASASTILPALGYPILPLGPTAALYCLATSRNETRPWTSAMTVTVVGFLAVRFGATAVANTTFPGVEMSHTGLAWAVAWFAGDRARLRREQLAELSERVASAERDAERERLLAIAEERARIARDLHDSAGHAVNVIAVRAGAARLRHDREPDRTVEAVAEIEDLARQTVAEIDHIVGALRDGPVRHGDVEVPPALTSLDQLVAQHAATGLDVMIETTGAPRPLGGAADQAAFRILQEALTNAARHGAGAARVELAFGASAISLRVTNPVAVDRTTRSGGGHGIIGMRERAALLGGYVDAERSNGQFRVRADIPYGARSR